MPIGPPPPGHRLEGTVNRFFWHTRRTQAYIQAVAPNVLGKTEASVEQYFLQSLVLMIHSHMEDFFKRSVSSAALLRPTELRQHISMYYPEETVLAETEPIFRLARTAADREVAFGKDAARLKRIFATLFGHAPFADAAAESDCLDLVLIRNLVTHDGAWPDGDDRSRVRRDDIILESGRVGTSTFYKLEISRTFLIDVLAALLRSVQALDGHLRNMPSFRI